MGGGLAGLEPRDPTAGKRETEHTDSSHIKDFLGGRRDGMQSVPLEIKAEEREGMREQEKTQKGGKEGDVDSVSWKEEEREKVGGAAF